MDVINVTENIQTAINLAYGEANDYYDEIIKHEEENFICKFLITFSEKDKHDGYNFGVMKLPEKENYEDNQYKFSKKEIFDETESTVGDADLSDICLCSDDANSECSDDFNLDDEDQLFGDEDQLFGDNLSEFSSDDSDIEVIVSEYNSELEDDYIMEKYFEFQYSEDDKSDEMEEIEFF